ncbi:MAG: L-serine ammonia-lyase, iron-sulfur-dependent subunit beta [Clostridia bacterium]
MHVFDIIGPIMIGPSSSHTAGAARIGRIVRRLLGRPPVRAVIGFHGSFAKTWQGHGTDRAVIGGLLDFPVDDARIRDSLLLAREAGLSYAFETVVLRDTHPNTMRLQVWAEGMTLPLVVEACSVGGGSIRVQRLGGMAVQFTGEAHTLIITHLDTPGRIAQVTSQLAHEQINIATMQVFRRHAGGEAVMVLETDMLPDDSAVAALRALSGIQSVTLLPKL